jgi:exonuclease SbcD
VRYAGSLLKYSFAEHAHDKSVCVADIGARGSAPGKAGQAGRAAVSVETVALSPRRDVRRVEGTLAELLERGASDPRSDDYVLASLLDRGALLDPIGQLRAVYPNALSIERPLYEAIGSGELHRPRPGSVGDLELFGTFFRYATGDEISPAEHAELAAVIDALDRRRREAGA